MSATQSNHAVAMHELLLANGAHAVVAVELHRWLLCCRLRFLSLWHRLVGSTLGSSRLPLLLDGLLQVVEYVHVALLSVVEP